MYSLAEVSDGSPKDVYVDPTPWYSEFISFEGRMTRGAYWTHVLLSWLACFACLYAVNLAFGRTTTAIIGGPTWTLVLLAQFPLHVKRCHDRDKPGWFMVVALVPYIYVWYWVEIGFFPGTDGPNRYGPDPLGGPLTLTQRFCNSCGTRDIFDGQYCTSCGAGFDAARSVSQPDPAS